MTKNRAPYFKVGEPVRVLVKYISGQRYVRGTVREVKRLNRDLLFKGSLEDLLFSKGFIYRVSIGTNEDEVVSEDMLKKHEVLPSVDFFEMLDQLNEGIT